MSLRAQKTGWGYADSKESDKSRCLRVAVNQCNKRDGVGDAMRWHTALEVVDLVDLRRHRN